MIETKPLYQDCDIRELQQQFHKQGLRHCAHLEESLSSYTTLDVGGVADIMVFPEEQWEVELTFDICKSFGIQPRILGGGSNLLVLSKHVPVVLVTKKLKKIAISPQRIEAQSGALLPLLVKKAVQHGCKGFDTLVGIPGTVGGAIAGNAGSKPEGVSSEIGDFVTTVTAVNPEGELLKLEKDAICFEYRNSNLRDHFILSAVFETERIDPSSLIQRWKKFFRKKSDSQPFSQKSAGCMFRNPIVAPAWKLICEAGLAGKRVGRAQVSSKHANFIVNLGGACAEEVWDLINIIRDRVRNLFGVDLVLEVQIW